jgi:trigger factor
MAEHDHDHDHDHDHGEHDHHHGAESTDGLSKSFHVTVPKGELVAKLEAKIEEIRPQVRLKGFRPGKVPASHIRKMFGRSMMDEIVEEAVSTSSAKMLSERNLRPAGQPHIHLECDAEAVAKGEADLDFHMYVEVMPEFTPVDPATLSFKRPTAAVTDEDVEKSLTELAESQITYEPKPKEEAAALKDSLLVDFVGKIDGVEFEGGKAEDAEIVLGAGRLIPGFEDQLVGAKAGDEVKVEVTFPEDYPNEDVKAKAATFDVTVKEVRQPLTPKADDALAKSMGLSDLDALKGAIKTSLEREFNNQSRMRAKRRLLDALDATHSFDLPKRMVEMEFNAIWQRVEQDMKNGQLDEEDSGKSEDELKTDYRKIAERRVRLGLVLAEIGRLNNVDVTAEELARAISAEARRYPGRETEIAKYLSERPEARAQLRAPIYEEKVVDFILGTAQVENEEVGREALFSEEA